MNDPAPAIEGFTLGELLGEGFSGAVYRARREAAGDEVALKVFAPERLEGRPRERFRREAELLRSLSHPCLVPLRDADLDHEPPWIAFAYLEGGDLARHTKRKRLLPLEEVRAAGARVARALAFLHEHDVAHRDVKPGNILRDGEGRAYLADLGMGRRDEPGDQRLTVSGQKVGTWTYMAPEVQLSGEGTRASDVYSFAVVMVQLLCGQIPRRTAQGVRMPAPLEEAGLPPALLGRLRQCLRTTPEDRPTDLTVLAEGLEP